MPTYSYQCKDGHKTETVKLMTEHTKTIICPDCGQEANQVLSGGSYATVDNMKPYKCVVSGEVVTTRTQRKEIMRKYDLVETGDTKGAHR